MLRRFFSMFKGPSSRFDRVKVRYKGATMEELYWLYRTMNGSGHTVKFLLQYNLPGAERFEVVEQLAICTVVMGRPNEDFVKAAYSAASLALKARGVETGKVLLDFDQFIEVDVNKKIEDMPQFAENIEPTPTADE